MGRVLTYQGIEGILLSEFPELWTPLEKTFGSYYDLKVEKPEAFPIFEDVLKRYLFGLLDLGGDDPFLPRIFLFLEQMARSADRNLTDLLGIAILEPLVSERHLVWRAWMYMGEKTKALAIEDARYRGCLSNLSPA